MKYKNIQANNISIGKNVVIEPSASIRGINGNANNIIIGDHTYIGENVQIICDDFQIGDYSKIHHHTNIHGYKPCKIGHNAWIGQYCLIDSIGGTTIGNNLGLGAHSQLWSHIKYGDTLEGCQFLSEQPLTIGNDVWFVGHCIVSPIDAQDKSMALVGSVLTKNMAFNEIYAGTPAKSISNKIGYQFKEVSVIEKFEKMKILLKEWGGNSNNIRIIQNDNEVEHNSTHTYFNVSTRTYNKQNTKDEIDFMKFLLPEKAKFTPL